MKRVRKTNKKATKGGKGWKKGQSASFNPQFNKHRLEAKKRAVFGNRGEGNLTEEKLAQHNKLIGEQCDDNDELMSIGEETAVTAFTNCSLPTFNRLLKNWNVRSFLHKEMLAVLAAVTDVLKANGGKETETEYFAALMTTLDVVDTDEGLTAVVCLLSMVVKRLNESILKLHHKTACETFMKFLIKYMNSDHTALLRNLLSILYAFLKVKAQWTDSSSDELKILLEFTTHHKPKVRKMAHQIVRTLLVDLIPEFSSTHPAASTVAHFCNQMLEKNAGSSPSRDIFYMLSLLEDIMSVFPKASVKISCETILRIMTLSNSMVTCSCLKALQGLFSKNPKADNLPVELNARIIVALYDYQPNVKEVQSLIYWLQVMEAAFVNLNLLDAKLCIGHLPKFYAVAVKCWYNDREDVMLTVASVLKNLLYKCIDPSTEVFQQQLLEDPVNNPMHKMFHTVEEALSYQYFKAWKHVLCVLTVFFEVTGKHCYTVMLKCLHSLADMHDSYKLRCICEVEEAIGTAIQHMGPRIVLQAIPLQINVESDKPDFPRSWLLPLLRDNVKNTELEFFVKYFLPLALKMRNKVLALQQEQKIVQSKLFDLICSQIWSLLPGFCTEPTDLKQCFKELARTLGIILKDEPSLRMTVLSSLRLLINKNLQNVENREEISKYSKNYLPILFNLYTTKANDKGEEMTRLAVYETCKTYLQITDKELCQTFFAKCLEKLQSDENDDFMQHALIDLAKAILPYVNENHINEIYEYSKPLLKHSNHRTQKKSYSVINELCSCTSESCKSFIKSHLEDMRVLLSGAMSGLTPSTKALRLNCLKHIVNQLSEQEKDFVVSIVPEAVLCVKESSIKARTAAYTLIIEIGHTLNRWKPDDTKGALREYMKLLLAGLAGSPHMMSATILAIGRVMYEFKDQLDSDLIHLFIENMCLLITSKSREVVLSALSFLKILFSTVDTVTLAQHVEYMVKSITNISEDNQRHFRFKAKELFTRLIRKFGYEMISKMVPDNYQKQLTNIRKTEARKSRKKNVANEESDSDIQNVDKTSDLFEDILADSDEEMRGNSSKRLKSVHKMAKHADSYLEEHGENDIIDFMDPSVNNRLIATKPVIPIKDKEKKHSNDFPLSKDGRLIIQDDMKTKSKQKNVEAMDIEEKEIMEELGAFKRKKRKFKEDSDDGGYDEASKDPIPVKKGIHRQIATAKRKNPGAEFKAKKAGGDIKKGKFEPYAYLPLNRQALNKRKQMKLQGQFKNVVNAARKGAIVGMKRKMRQAKRRKNN